MSTGTTGRLIARYEPLLRSSVRRRLGAALFRAEGEDVLQALRLAILSGLPSLRSKGSRSFSAWLKKVVRSRLLDWEKARRSRRRHPSRPVVRLDATDAPEVAASSPSPSSILMDQERREELERAIRAAPPRYQALLWFIYRESPSPAEVARFLGKEPEGARKFVARALTHLRQAIRCSRRGSSSWH